MDADVIANGRCAAYPLHANPVLSKREMFAATIAAGLATRKGYDNPSNLASDAVRAADALLAELAKG